MNLWVFGWQNGKEDIRSSYYLEDVASEFQVQRLELDWACVTWDGDFRYFPEGWQCFSFVAVDGIILIRTFLND